MTTKPKTRKAPPGINPKLIALAAKIDKAEAKFNRALDVLRVADEKFFCNRENADAQAAKLEVGLKLRATPAQRVLQRVWQLSY